MNYTIEKAICIKEDLPEWYVEGFVYKTSGFISAKGVQHLIYKPCFTNHLFKDYNLFISYEKPIISNINSYWPEEYDESLNGQMIPLFIAAVKVYSGYDTSEIKAAIAEKRKWFAEQYPDSPESDFNKLGMI